MWGDDIRDWITTNACVVDPDHGRCRKIVVSRLDTQKREIDEVYEKDMSSVSPSDVTDYVRVVVMEIVAVTQDDADGSRSGVQTYGIFMYFTGDERYVPRRVFRVVPSSD